jgi:hypothetical protein
MAFVKIWNSSSYEELRVERPFSTKKLEQSEFLRLKQNFESDLYDIRNEILKVSQAALPIEGRNPESMAVIGELLLVT